MPKKQKISPNGMRLVKSAITESLKLLKIRTKTKKYLYNRRKVSTGTKKNRKKAPTTNRIL